MLVEIKCPSCSNRSSMEAGRIPPSRVRTACNRCGAKFPLDKTRGENCRPLAEPAPQSGWRVDHPICAGIEYDLNGLGGLIRSGLLQPETQVAPPGATNTTPARQDPRLRPLFDRQAAAQARARRF